jgi:hypothetical protein
MQENTINIPEIKLDDMSDVKVVADEPVAETGAVSFGSKLNLHLNKLRNIVKRKSNLPFSTSGNRNRKGMKIAGMVLGVILVVIIILGVAIGIPGLAIYNKAKILNADAKDIKASFTKQDINLVETSVSKFKTDLVSFQTSFSLLGWTRILPVIGNYWSDGDHAIKGGLDGIDAAQIGIQTAKPYADIIGFSGANGKKAANAEENANDRIQFLVSTIKDILPKVDQVSQKADAAQKEFDQIDPNRYPESFSGKAVRSQLRKAIDLMDQGAGLVVNSKPLLQAAPYLMGVDAPRTYLVLFQNDKELRPTGGFITGYSVMTVDKGKVSNVSSNDIYNLDKAYTPAIKAPDPIIKYIKGPYAISTGLRLRDMNFSPDFKTSMQMFVTESQKAGIGKIDGVIGVDTQALLNLLSVLGNVGVPGYGNFNTTIVPECNCPQVIHELESFADVEGSIVWDQNDPTKIIFAPSNYLNRKAIVGPLMNSVLKNALGQPKEKIPGLFQAAWNSLTQKHVLFYMLDANAQKGVESFDLAGRVQDTSSQSDYLLINDANLGGRKSNLYVTNEVDQSVSIANDGSVTKTVTLTYKNSQGYDGWLNSVLPSWLRIYVPKGSTLISLDGLDDKQAAYEDLGKTVFAGSYSLRPLGVSKITIKYKLPFKVKNEYDLFVQKQPGVDSIMQTIKVGRQEQSAILKADQEFKFKL